MASLAREKKELIGLYKNPGKTWCKTATPVNDHDFRSQAVGLAAPYGIYDPRRNCGLLVVGRSADTPEFAANSILTWWRTHGREHYPNATCLLILADAGGSNGARCRAWKKFLQEKIADGCGLTVTVAHYPTGASKWNPVEHRMFSEITKNWAAVPLESFDTVVNWASTTETATGLRVAACHDSAVYQKGTKVSDRQMREIKLTTSDVLGKWNYTISPGACPGCTQSEPNPEAVIPRCSASSDVASRQRERRTHPHDRTRNPAHNPGARAPVIE